MQEASLPACSGLYPGPNGLYRSVYDTLHCLHSVAEASPWPSCRYYFYLWGGPDPVRQLLASSSPYDQCLYPMIVHRAQVALPFMIVGM